jgi:hypothetical protein
MSVAASRRWCQVFCMLLAVGLVARIGLGLALPWLLDRAARAAGCTLRCQATSLSLLGASFEVRGLALRAGAAPLAGCAVARADVDVSALCRGELRVHEVAVDGAEIWLQRGADGRWNWPRSAAAPEAVATTPAPTVAPQPVVLDFGLPASVGVLRLGALRVHLDDAATVPRFVGLLTGDLTVFELGNRERPARLAAEFAVAEVLDALRVEGTWRGGLRTAELDLRLTVRGARPQACRGYLEPAGVVPAAERIDLRAALALQLRPRRDDPAGAFGELRVSAAVTVDSSEHLACDAIAVDLGHVDRRRCDVAQVTVTGVRGRAARRTDGGLRVLGVDLPAPTSAGVPAAPPPPSAPAAGLQLRVARAAVRDVAIAWADAAVSPPAQLAVELAQLEATELLPAPGRTTRAELELRVPQVMDKLEVRATWTPAAPGRTGADGACELQASGVTLRAVRPYLTAAGIEPVLNSGGFAAALRTHLDGDHFAVELGPVRLTDGAQEWLALDALAVRGDTSAGGAPHLGKVELRGLRAAVERTAAGALRVGGLALVPLPSAMPAPAPAPPSTDAPPGLRLDDLIVAGVALRWRDALVLDEQGQPTELALDDLTATVRSFELGAGLPRCAHAEVRVRSAALADTIAFTAAARTAEAPNRAQATVQLEAVRLGALRGYLRAAGLEPEARQWTAGLSLRADCDPRGAEPHRRRTSRSGRGRGWRSGARGAQCIAQRSRMGTNSARGDVHGGRSRGHRGAGRRWGAAPGWPARVGRHSAATGHTRRSDRGCACCRCGPGARPVCARSRGAALERRGGRTAARARRRTGTVERGDRPWP